jgi:peroxiredoxin
VSAGPGEGEGDERRRTADGELTRLDPEARRDPAPEEADPPREPWTPAPVIDTRRYRWAVGIIGLAVVIAVSIIQFATHGVGTTGVPAGHRLRWFAAPLADSTLVGDPNLHPPCTAVRHDARALNLCLLAGRGPIVLSLFVGASPACVRQVDALQTLSRRYRTVQFAAVAIKAGRAATARLVRDHHWTIPVAYDRDGSVGELYGVAICPMAELAQRGGIVRGRLIGERWQGTAALGAQVRALVGARP